MPRILWNTVYSGCETVCVDCSVLKKSLNGWVMDYFFRGMGHGLFFNLNVSVSFVGRLLGHVPLGRCLNVPEDCLQLMTK